MKTFISILLVIISANTYAQDGLYIGVDTSTTQVESSTYKDDNISGFGMTLGYDTAINQQFIVGVEFKYSFLGEVERSSRIGNRVMYVKSDVYSTELLVKPKYKLNSNLYFGGIIGFVDVDVEVSDTNYKYLSKRDESFSAFTYGGLIGYEFYNGFAMEAGLKLQDLDYATTGYFGVNYKF